MTSTAQDVFARGIDRRRIPRYSCVGRAQIASLPLRGSLLTGTLRDLGLGGCCVEHITTASPFDLETRTEILVKVNSWSFRAMAQVKSLRSHSGISVEFLRLSAGGYNMLADLIADLVRMRTVTSHVERFPEHSRKLSLSNTGRSLNRTKSAAIVGTVVSAESAEEMLTASRHAWLRDSYPGAISLDIHA
jgi:hypothetical protein